MKYFSLFTTACILSLSACSTAPTKTEPQRQVSAPKPTATNPYQERLQTLQGKSKWGMVGKASVRTAARAFPMAINWQQSNPQAYTIRIQDPFLGATLATLSKAGGAVTLQTSNGQSYSAASAEQLLQQNTGISMPVSGLRYWVLGVPVPGQAVQAKKLDANGRLLSLTQSGWQINYAQYQGNTALAMPRQITLSNPAKQVNVKVIANSWQLN